jgi:predicted DNA-binding transcriptional regulator YafY
VSYFNDIIKSVRSKFKKKLRLYREADLYMNSEDKLYRILSIFFRGIKGEDLSVMSLANEFGVSKKTITRDINDLKAFFTEHRDTLGYTEIKYSYQQRTYRFYFDDFLLDKELLAIVKILIASRTLSRTDMIALVDKLKRLSSCKDKKMLNNMVSKELYHYVSIGSDTPHVTDRLWQISSAIEAKKEITITYYKMDRSQIVRRIAPASVIFSEYYFYLIAFHADENGALHQRFYRIDRITDIILHRDVIMEHPSFNEGELRKLNQFMFPGKKQRILFEFTGPSLQAVLDRLPTAKLISTGNGINIIEAFVYGDGIKMWLLSQGDWIKVLEPAELAEEIRLTAARIAEKYKKIE